MYGSDGEVVLITEATALPGRTDDLRRAFIELIPQSLAEGAVSTFRLHEDRDRPGHFALYQRYDVQGARARRLAGGGDTRRPIARLEPPRDSAVRPDRRPRPRAGSRPRSARPPSD